MVYIVGIIAIILIFLFINMQGKNKKEKAIIFLTKSNYIIDYIRDYLIKDKIAIDQIYMYDYNEFENHYKQELIAAINNDIDNHKFDEYIAHLYDKSFTNDCIKEAVKNIVYNNQWVNNFIQSNFLNIVNSGIKEATDHEEKAIEYHKQFGEEPEGDPKLHSKEPNTDQYNIEDSPEKTLEELISTGTVEEYTDTLEEI